MNETRSVRNSDIHWVVGGAVFLMTMGMIMITISTVLAPNASTLVTTIGGMVTVGVAGIFGLWKVNDSALTKLDANTVKIDANTALTEKVSTETKDISKQLNGTLDKRIREIVTEVVYEALDSWTAPTRRSR